MGDRVFTGKPRDQRRVLFTLKDGGDPEPGDMLRGRARGGPGLRQSREAEEA